MCVCVCVCVCVSNFATYKKVLVYLFICSIYRFYFPLYILWAYIVIFFSLFMCIIYFSTTVSTLWKSIYFNSHFREALLIDLLIEGCIHCHD